MNTWISSDAIMPLVGKKKLSQFILYFCGLFIVYYWYSTNFPLSKKESMVPVTIEQGQGVSSIAQSLKDKKLIRSPLTFKLYVFTHRLNNSLQAGDYELSANKSAREIVADLQHGTFDVRLTFLEGWRVEEMADYISSLNKVNFSGVDFLTAAKTYEGKLFPDTYVVPRYINAQDMVSLMVSNYNEQVRGVREGFASTSFSENQVLTLASIIEREVRSNEDRPIVAEIFLRRLDKGWPLQADATVQYVLGYQTEADPGSGEIEGTWWKENLTQRDLEVTSPYNTRAAEGLPPGPICNPGLKSIEAVLHPAKETGYWYYLSDQEGRMHYADTLEQHEQNIATYLR